VRNETGGREAAAWKYLTDLEAQFKVIGLSPQSRVKRSLFEMYGNK